MNSTQTAVAIICLAMFCGCEKPQPTLTGGKPISFWLEAARDPDAKQRKQAMQKLGNAGNIDPAIATTLIAALKDKDSLVRREAILALLKVGDEAQQAVSALTEIKSKDRDAKTREYAAKALEKLSRALPGEKP